MTDLRNLNRAVQNAEFPSHEWAQAVREWIDKATERMELVTPRTIHINCSLCGAPWVTGHDCTQPASEGAKVECENCRQRVDYADQHYHREDMPHVPAFYTCQSAQPEPAAPVGEMPEISELDDRHDRMASPEYQAKVKADMNRRAVEIGVDRLVGVSAFPVGNCPVCDELVAPWNKHAKYEGGYTCKPAPVGEMPVEIRKAIWTLHQMKLPECDGAADDLAAFWRTHAAQPKVAMTEELERVLDVAKWEAHSIRSIADGDYPNSPQSRGGVAEADKIDAAIAAVRAQAAGVKLPKVRHWLAISEAHANHVGKGQHWLDALAELDAAESNNKGDL